MMAGIVELHQFRIQKRQKMAKTACARYAKMRRWKKEQRPLANTPGRLGSFSVTCFGLLDYAAHLEWMWWTLMGLLHRDESLNHVRLFLTPISMSIIAVIGWQRSCKPSAQTTMMMIILIVWRLRSWSWLSWSWTWWWWSWWSWLLSWLAAELWRLCRLQLEWPLRVRLLSEDPDESSDLQLGRWHAALHMMNIYEMG